MEKVVHRPVLLKESIYWLDARKNKNFVDATCGEGSFAKTLLEKTSPEGKVLCIDLNKEALKIARKVLKEFKDRAIFVNSNFSNIKGIIKSKKINFVLDGIYADLGISRFLLERSKRGFSFKKNEILDLRYGDFKGKKAFEILNNSSKKDLERIFKEYGEEKYYKLAAKAIVNFRKSKYIITTFDLLSALKPIEKFYYKKRIHYATKIFQALRIEVNKELENLKALIKDGIDVISRGGRIVIISYHSLEDRIVKNYFKELKKQGRCEILTKKPIRPTFEEIKKNPSSRSAKLRAIKKL